MDKLKKVEVNVETGIVKVNDTVFENIDSFRMIFENGVLSLDIHSDFFADGTKLAVRKKGVPRSSAKRPGDFPDNRFAVCFAADEYSRAEGHYDK